jgi:hypothetical protein
VFPHVNSGVGYVKGTEYNVKIRGMIGYHDAGLWQSVFCLNIYDPGNYKTSKRNYSGPEPLKSVYGVEPFAAEGDIKKREKKNERYGKAEQEPDLPNRTKNVLEQFH